MAPLRHIRKGNDESIAYVIIVLVLAFSEVRIWAELSRHDTTAPVDTPVIDLKF
jgi:hypothetical protein